MQDLNDKSTGGNLSAAEWNELPSEIQNVITALGIVLSGGDLNQLGKAIAGYAGAGTFYTESGAADAYVAGVIGSKQGPAALNADHDGLLVRFRASNTNTGATTLNLNGLGAKAIVREDFSVLQAGDIPTVKDTVVRYRHSATDFVLAQHILPASADVSQSYLAGLGTQRDAGDTAHDIEISPGICRDDGDAATIDLTAIITKQIDSVAGWVAGDNAAGLPSAIDPVVVDETYHVFVIKNPTTGVVDAGFDTNILATNLLADATGYTLFRRVASIRTDGSANIIAYSQRGNVFLLDVPVLEFNDSNPGSGSAFDIDRTLSVPTDIQVGALFTGQGRDSTPGATFQAFYSKDIADISPPGTTNGFDIEIGANNEKPSIHKTIRTNTSAQIRVSGSGSNADIDIRGTTFGWIDTRGQGD